MKRYTAGLQLPETKETIFRLGPKLVVLLLRGPVCQGLRYVVELVISNKIRILVDLKCNLCRSKATISPPSKGHLDGVSLAGHSWLNFTCLLGRKSAQSVISLLCDLSALHKKFNDLVCKNGLKCKTNGPPPSLSVQQIVEGLI